MGKRLPYTPNSQIRSALRNLWLRSRERAATLKRDNHTCRCCKKKQSKAKGKEFSVQVHHLYGVGNWDVVIDIIRKELLCSPTNLVTLCKDCHDLIGKDG